ncbi:hypothetical protein [Modicisalibacter luteus]|uniref:Peptidase C51 domain-containing protein n=1 Tax=Modicisalibacter luteus TaxID=453962 RepID=A0ABV7LWA2_9GAMM|nr:hypothetical protein [Halomonas lutea]GHB11430.1 hypothetical protein GCM10007159_36970 [Halomonas lutea]
MRTTYFIARALSALNKNTRYDLPGITPPFAAEQWPENSSIDCSGFINWCLRFSESRKVKHPLYERTNGGWFETSAIYADAKSPVGYFTEIKEAVSGALLVYPDQVKSGYKREGHIAIILRSHGKNISDIEKIIHCSNGAYKADGDAIKVTDPQVFLKNTKTIIVWFDGLQP